MKRISLPCIVEIVAVPLISPKTYLFIVERTYRFCQWYFSCMALFRQWVVRPRYFLARPTNPNETVRQRVNLWPTNAEP
jgi:hypothetical protein